MRLPRFILVAAVILVSAAACLAEENIARNDSLEDGGTGFVCPCFAEGEEGAAWLTSPCDGMLIGVQILWKSQGSPQPQSLEDEIIIYEAGTFPNPGSVMTSQNVPPQPAIFEGPVMTDGFLIEFRYLDESNSVPLRVPVSQGETFVVSFKFFNANENQLDKPSLVLDSDGCQNGKNAVNASGQGWINLCTEGASGDWVIRAIVECDDAFGACCLTDGSCVESLTTAECSVQGGTYQGDSTICSTVNCPQPSGGCCLSNGTCVSDISALDCNAQDGTFLGEGVVCDADSCKGACCVESSESCVNFTESNCNGAGGTFNGIGTNCATLVCFPRGACCLPDGSCLEDERDTDCVSLGGVFQGDQVLCSEVTCPVPDGACCADNGNCLTDVSEPDCVAINGEWGGPLTDCSDLNGNSLPDICEVDCPADIDPPPNGNGQVDVDDLGLVFVEWGNPGGDADVDGDGDVDVDDLGEIFTNWGPCP